MKILSYIKSHKILTSIVCVALVMVTLVSIFDFNLLRIPLKDYYGEKYPYVLHCDIYKLFGIEIYKPTIYRPKKLQNVDIGSNEKETFNNIVSILVTIKYNESQNNPDIVEEFGGNCQAISLLLDSYCKKVKIESHIKYNDTHMWNIVRLDNKLYSVDIVNGKMERL